MTTYNFNNLIPQEIASNISMRMTCGACPEQYDMYYNGSYVGYFRLRHGSYSVWDSNQINDLYRASPYGDGCFDDDNEREFFLTMGQLAVLSHINEISLEHSLPESISEYNDKREIYSSGSDNPLIHIYS